MQRFHTVVVFAFLAVASLAARQTLQQVAPPAPQRPADDADPNKQPAAATVRGHVFGADTSQPLRKAQVRLFSTEVANGGKNENRQAMTDASGSYEFKELPAGKYLMSANKGGYVGMTVGQMRPNEPGKPITLLASELRERVDFTLLRGGVITGRVVDEYGEPISRIQIGAMRSETIGGRKQLMPSGRMTSTDDLGEFRIFGISPGQYYVQATWHGMTPVMAPGAPADEETGYATTFFPGTSAASEAQRLTVAGGQTISDVAFAMVPAKTARVSGTVVDSHGGPAQGMLMISRHESGTIESGINMSVPIRPDGTFVLANLSPGDYTLRAMLMGPKREAAVVTVSVAGMDITDVALTTVPPSSATGRIIVDPSVSQTLASATLSVLATPMEPSGFDPGRVPARVADDLTFKLDVPAGLVQIVVMGQPSGFGVRAVRIGGVDVTDSGVEFKVGRDVTGLEIELTNRLTTVSGLVSDSRGDRAKDYSVVVFPQDPSRWMMRSRYMRVARPDEDGRFKISGLPLGEYYAIALDRIDNVAWNDAEFLQSVQPQATMFSLMDAETKTLDLRLRPAPQR
ncbi:MAG TPA: carboxypeptidase-like regulatory domain-containing protein [Vicinamibacterales bacterium]